LAIQRPLEDPNQLPSLRSVSGPSGLLLIPIFDSWLMIRSSESLRTSGSRDLPCIIPSGTGWRHTSPLSGLKMCLGLQHTGHRHSELRGSSGCRMGQAVRFDPLPSAYLRKTSDATKLADRIGL
jgi:hypothetical protein